jgi:plastocyanin
MHKILPRLRIAALCGVFAVASAAGVFARSASAGETVRIDIDRFAFSPKDITVEVGTTVVWINHDQTPHTIAAADQTFVSKGLDTDDRYEHTFADEGDVPYFCTVHPFMTGVVHVRKP